MFLVRENRENPRSRRLFRIPKTFRNERNVVEGVEGRGVWSVGAQRVWSEAGVPFGGAERKTLRPGTEDVATLRGRRNDPERLERREVSGENV